MNKMISSIGVVALCFGSMAMMHNRNLAEANRQVTAWQVTSAPYRDGLYEGKLSAERGANRGIPRARWARQEDRDAFVAGFQKGCSTCHGTVGQELVRP
jgi:hypothetical protein